MGNNETRLVSTAVVWTAFTAIMIAAMVTGADGSGFLVGFALLLIGVVSATRIIWKYGGDVQPGMMTEKTKRCSRVDRVLAKMDETELEELRDRLRDGSDGETVGLDELLAEHQRR